MLARKREEVMRTFGEALSRERRDRGDSFHILAKSVSVPERRVRAWERGEALPTRAEFARLTKHLKALRNMRFPDFEPAAKPPAEMPPAETPEAQIELGLEETQFGSTFGRALLLEREREGVTQEEVGYVIGVTGQAVGHWESNRSIPVRAHYLRLVELFPMLAFAPQPAVAEYAPPDGGRGVARPHFAAGVLQRLVALDGGRSPETPEPESVETPEEETSSEETPEQTLELEETPEQTPETPEPEPEPSEEETREPDVPPEPAKGDDMLAVVQLIEMLGAEVAVHVRCRREQGWSIEVEDPPLHVRGAASVSDAVAGIRRLLVLHVAAARDAKLADLARLESLLRAVRGDS